MILAVILINTICLCTALDDYTQVSYFIPPGPLSGRTAPLHSWFRPIRIHVHEVDLAHHLPDVSSQDLYRELISDGLDLIRQLLQVFPVSDTLKLEYDYSKLCENPLQSSVRLCGQKWSNVVVNEDCGVREGFQIPAEHMAEFRIYSSETEYTVDIPGGAGINDTDIVLYVSAKSLDYCNVQNAGILGFAKICKRDQFGRPIASFLNMCPDGFSSASKAKLKDTIFHEILHSMGFLGSSLNLFIQSCEITNRQLDCKFLSDYYTDSYRFPWHVLRDNSPSESDYRYEIKSTNALTAWQHHLGCDTAPDDGPVWSVHASPNPARQNPIPGDHWTWTSMMGSLMSPFVKEPYMQLLDNMTVSWFKDTGWYFVSDNLTQPLLWGKNSGCDFAHPVNYCQKVVNGELQDRFLCQQSGKSGCHYLHLHKGVCTPTESRVPMCRYYKPDPQGDCFTPRSVTDSLEEFCQECRCFVSSLHETESVTSEPTCLRRRCTQTGLQVSINGSWVSCPYNQTIVVEGLKGTIQCPASDVLCTPRDLSLSDVLSVAATTTTSTTTTIKLFSSGISTQGTSQPSRVHSCDVTGGYNAASSLICYLSVYIYSFNIFVSIFITR